MTEQEIASLEALAIEDQDGEGFGTDETQAYARRVLRLCAELRKARTALATIAKGEGAFSRDPLQHANNVILDAIKTAEDALGGR